LYSVKYTYIKKTLYYKSGPDNDQDDDRPACHSYYIYMNEFKSLLIACLAMILSGCALVKKEVPEQPQAEAEVSAETRLSAEMPELPAMELEPELLYSLMVAEFAGQRGELPLSVDTYVATARATQDARNYEAALETARLWVKLDRGTLDGRQMLAVLLLRSGDVDGAVQHFNEILNAESLKEAHRYMMVAGLLAREQDKLRAMRVMDSLMSSRQNNAYAMFAYAFLAEQTGNLDGARASIEQALKLRPDWTQATIQYAQILRLQRETDLALKVLKKGLRSDRKNIQLRLTYARTLVEARQLDKARRQFEILSEQAPDNADILYALGILSLQAENLSTAQGYFSRLYDLGKRTDEASFYLGQIAETEQDNETAIGWYNEITVRSKHYLDARIRAAFLMSKEDRLTQAREYLRQTTSRSSKQQIQLYLAEADLLRDAEQYQEAMELLTDALEKHPNDVDLLYSRSLIAEKVDRLDISEKDLRLVLKIEPDNAHALNALGYTLADRTNRYKEAYELIQRAYELRPEDPSILDSLGWVLYRMGRYPESVEYLKKALGLNDDGEIAAHLGEVLWVMGRTDEARKVWSRAAKSFPDHKLLMEVMKRYDQ
jgi:tetratricopeptide (TPR) repeat protein